MKEEGIVTMMKRNISVVISHERGRNCDYDETEHISGHLWHRYTVKVNQVMKVRVKF
jgi:hypothetical protein